MQIRRKERKSDLPVEQPIRRSRRLNRDVPEDCDDTVDTVIVSTKAKVTYNQVQKLSLNRCVNPFKEEWLENVGTKLFEIISLERKRPYEKAVDDCKAPRKYFDYEFYNDLNERSEYIETSKITKEFKVAEERRIQ